MLRQSWDNSAYPVTFTWALRWGCLRWESSCQELRGILTSTGCEVPGPSSWWTLPWWLWPHRHELEPLGHSPTHHKTLRADLGGIRREQESEGTRTKTGYRMKTVNSTLWRDIILLSDHFTFVRSLFGEKYQDWKCMSKNQSRYLLPELRKRNILRHRSDWSLSSEKDTWKPKPY